MLVRTRPLLLASLLAGALPLLNGQTTTAPFNIRVQLPDTSLEVTDGATVTVPAAGIGEAVSVNTFFTFRGTSVATVNFVQLTGSADFTLTRAPEVPFAVVPNGVFAVQVSYRAATSLRTSGRLAFNYTVGTTSTTVSLNLSGVAPEFVYSYTPQGGNAQTVTSGTTLQFPPTAIDATSTAVLVLANRGTYQGVFNGATVTGAEFQTVGVPLSGTVVEAGRDLRFTVSFTPRQLEAARGSLTVQTADRTVTFPLEGSGSGARYVYETIQDGAARPLLPNQALSLPDTAIGEKASIVVRIRNAGNADGRITTIAASGTGFSLSEVPLLPVTVPTGQAFTFAVNFQPTAPGRQLGRLRVGNDDFDLSGLGLGPALNYAFVSNNVSTSVSPNGSVIFTPAAVGARSSLRFTITNSGTSATTVSSIGLAAPSTIFTLQNLPSLPASVPINGSVGFDIVFAPNALGVSTATLRVDAQSFTLSGAGNAPPPLPEIRFDGSSGAQQALQQPAVGLLLAQAYPLALTGTLTLTFSSDVFSNDPAVQFATGARTVSFTIPANSTRAVFPNNASQIRVQTGSLAGTISLTPAISTTEGSINLTPATPPTLNLTVAPAAPQILNAAVSARTSTSITIQVNGYSTARSVTQMDLTFTPVSGENVTTQRVTIPVEGAFLGYYQGTQSAAFGSLFSATVPLTLSGDVKNVTTLVDTLQSVSITLTNRLGTSPAVTLNLK